MALNVSIIEDAALTWLGEVVPVSRLRDTLLPKLLSGELSVSVDAKAAGAVT